MSPQISNTTVITHHFLTRPPTRKSFQSPVPLPTPHCCREPIQLHIPFRTAQIPQLHHTPRADDLTALPWQLGRARHRAPQVPAGRLRRDNVDEGVPEALQGQDERLGVVESEAVLIRVDESVEPVDARGHPGDEQGAEEEEGHARVQPGFRIGFAERGVAGQIAHSEEVRRGVFALLLVVWVLWADFYVHGVWIEAIACSGGVHAGDCHFGVIVVVGGGFAAGVGCDVDFDGDGAFEGVFVEGIEEASKMMAVLPDFAESHRVNDHSEEECDPGLRHG